MASLSLPTLISEHHDLLSPRSDLSFTIFLKEENTSKSGGTAIWLFDWKLNSILSIIISILDHKADIASLIINTAHRYSSVVGLDIKVRLAGPSLRMLRGVPLVQISGHASKFFNKDTMMLPMSTVPHMIQWLDTILGERKSSSGHTDVTLTRSSVQCKSKSDAELACLAYGACLMVRDVMNQDIYRSINQTSLMSQKQVMRLVKEIGLVFFRKARMWYHAWGVNLSAQNVMLILVNVSTMAEQEVGGDLGEYHYLRACAMKHIHDAATSSREQVTSKFIDVLERDVSRASHYRAKAHAETCFGRDEDDDCPALFDDLRKEYEQKFGPIIKVSLVPWSDGASGFCSAPPEVMQRWQSNGLADSFPTRNQIDTTGLLHLKAAMKAANVAKVGRVLSMMKRGMVPDEATEEWICSLVSETD